jgi:hypothetical protein
MQGLNRQTGHPALIDESCRLVPPTAIGQQAAKVEVRIVPVESERPVSRVLCGAIEVDCEGHGTAFHVSAPPFVWICATPFVGTSAGRQMVPQFEQR